MHSAKKRAIMGIGTLIIFIATILVAAVAAGVLISTSGILQQRALITGQEARKKITNSIEIISIIAHGNKTDESLNDYEILVRLDAGSDPIQMKKFDVSWIGPTHDASSILKHWTLNTNAEFDGFNDEVGTVNNVSWTYIRDLDGDNILDRVRIETNWSQGNHVNSTGLLFNMSEAGLYFYDIPYEIGAISSRVEWDIENEPIIGEDGHHYGYMFIYGNTTIENTISDVNATFNITSNPNECEFYSLEPETGYCYEVMHGDEDLVLGDGEVFKLKFKLLHENRMFIGQEFRFIFSSEKGRLSQATARTPDVITTLKVPLWPVG